jgi:hypothetical protein
MDSEKIAQVFSKSSMTTANIRARCCPERRNTDLNAARKKAANGDYDDLDLGSADAEDIAIKLGSGEIS